jgi:hypothetical protein
MSPTSAPTPNPKANRKSRDSTAPEITRIQARRMATQLRLRRAPEDFREARAAP